MKRIALISDTHNYLDPKLFKYLEECDEIWHAGDIGSIKIIEQLEKIKPVKAVYGNIDGQDVRRVHPKNQRFFCEGTDVLMTHIGGYPDRYVAEVKKELERNPPKIFICGHSHILKIIYDKKYNLLHINPGSCGIHGIHRVKTMVRFTIDGEKIQNMEVVELGKNNNLSDSVCRAD